MKTLVVYDTQFGNTEQVARAIASRLEAQGPVRLLPVGDATVADLSGIDLLLVGGPTQAHGARPVLRTWAAGLPESALRGLAVATFDTRASGPVFLTGSAAKVVARALRRHGVELVTPPECFLVSGKEGPLADGELERAATWAETVAATVVSGAVLAR